MQFYIGEFYEKLLSHFILYLGWIVLTITLLHDLQAFLHTDVFASHLCSLTFRVQGGKIKISMFLL